ncbi:T9SS type A sorting domain-containing protein [Chryseobacterium sp. CH21]|uniref:T9SS type A sorting domain-containing protein n=1 Tax=Chryseobacterium sp. CH21 TaxID=713556 RepID=UPI001E65C0C4|nr:T9SS type A sorting domain-containing protein [Chryseobacterium sp. CH21]
MVNDLGIIKDDSSNGRNSFTAMETGFGGDMIADTDNNFYVFSASGNVFKVLTKDLTAKFVGKITGIPDNYSVNGSAVNAQGKIVIASAKGGALYEVDLTTLQAKQLPGEQGLHIYDLASKYFVNDKATTTNTLADLDIYPTKIDEHYINIHVNKNVKGNIQLNVFDMSGKNVMTQNLTVKDNSSDERVYLKGLVSGAYIVNITNESGKTIFNKKVLITK